MTSDEHQQILDDLRTCNLVRKKIGENREQAISTKGNMNFQIKQLQAKLDANKKRLAYIPGVNESDDNSVDPSNSIKRRKDNKQNFHSNNN